MRARHSKITVYAALTANLAIAISKYITAGFTGSSSMLSEGIHSTVDTGNQLLLLLGISKSEKPADKEHPFGYGKEIYFWSLIVAILIFAIGGGISAYEGVIHLIGKPKVERSYWNYIILGTSFIFESISFYIAHKNFRKTTPDKDLYTAIVKSKDPASFLTLLEDAAALLGILFAATGITLTALTNNPLYDGIASICIGLLLALVALFLVRETKGLLIGESANKEVIIEVETILKEDSRISFFDRPLTMQLGPDQIFIALNLKLKPEKNMQVKELFLSIEEKIYAVNSKIKLVFFNISETKT